MEALQNYTNLDVTSPGGTLVHELDVKIQSVPDVRWKFLTARKRARPPPNPPAKELLNMAFKVFN